MSFLSLEHDDAMRSKARRARVVTVDDSGSQQKADLRGLASDRPQKIVRILPHGYSSNPPQDSEGVLLALGGRSDRLMFIGGEHKDYRPKNLKSGQSVLYDDKGNVVFSKGSDGLSVNAKTGVVEIRSQDNKVTVKPGTGQNVYLGGDGADGAYAKVMTESGASLNVYARIS
jgi:phage gp45-like